MNVTFLTFRIFFCLARAQIAVEKCVIWQKYFRPLFRKTVAKKIRECSTNPLVMCLISTTTTIFGIAWVRVSKRVSLCLLKQSESHFPSTCFQEISNERGGGSLHHHPWNKPVVYCGSKLNRSCPCRVLPSNFQFWLFWRNGIVCIKLLSIQNVGFFTAFRYACFIDVVKEMEIMKSFVLR